MMGRGRVERLWLAIGVLTSCASCGWHPVYAPRASDQAGVATALGRIDVAIIGERQGQLLRQALQARLGGSGRGTGSSGAGYLLTPSYSLSQESVGIQPDSSVTRVRLIATSNFVLRSFQADARTCLSGDVRAVDGYDMQNEQFFASDLAAETAENRLANAVADQIVLRLALALGTAKGQRCEAG